MPQYKVKFYHMVQGMDHPDKRDLGVVEADDELSARKQAAHGLCLREGGDPNCSYTLSCISARLVKTNVVEFESKADRRKRISKEFETEMKSHPGSAGENTDLIWQMEEVLTAIGWKVDLHHRHNIPEMTAYVDYEARTLWLNNHKAMHTRITLERIKENIEDFGISEGKYVYQWVDSEDFWYESGETGTRMTLAVRRYDDAVDGKPLTPEDTKHTDAIRLELSGPLGKE
ncbi:hypothetical protein Peetri_00100 [Pseudomonas phage vB_PpuM-Peetri]